MNSLHARAGSIRNGIWEAGLLLVLPLIFHPGFAEPFTTPKLFLAKCLVVCGLALSVLDWSRCSHLYKQRPRLLPPLLAFSLAALISCLSGPVPRFSLSEIEFALCGPAWALLLLSWNEGASGVRRIYFWISFAGGLVAAVVLVQRCGFDPVLLHGYQVDWGSMVARMRLYSTLGNPNFVGGYLIGAIFPALALAARSKSPLGRVLGSIAALGMLSAIILTGSRGAWWGLAVGICVAAILLLRRRAVSDTQSDLPPMRAASSAANSKGKGLLSISSLANWPIATLTLSLAERVAAQLQGRFYLWRFSWPAFWQHPLLGSGWGGYQLAYLELQGKFLSNHPEYSHFWTNNRLLHNDPLQLLLETGIVGFASFAWVVWTYGREAWAASHFDSRFTSYANAAGAASVSAILADSFFNYQFAVPPTYILLFTLLAVPSLLLSPESGPYRAPASAPVHGCPLVPRILATGLALALAGGLLRQQWRILRSEFVYQAALDREEHEQLEKAESAFRQSVALNDLNGRAHFGLSRVLYVRGSSIEALREISRAEQTYSDSHEEVLRARILEQMGRTNQAVAAYRHALMLDPTLTTPQQDIERLSGRQ